MTEIWKPFKEGTYEVSNHGRARRARPGKNTSVGKILKPAKDTSGYLYFRPYINGICKKNILLHRAVAELFIGKIPENKCVNHIDGCKTNNHVSNLEIVTYSENNIHAFKAGLTVTGDDHWTRKYPEKRLLGTRNPKCKLTEKDVMEIRKLYKEGMYQTKIAEKYNVGYTCIQKIVRRINWSHI